MMKPLQLLTHEENFQLINGKPKHLKRRYKKDCL